MMDTERYLRQAVDLFEDALGEHLSGIYLHGSLAMGCYRPEQSDIDLLVVIHNKAPFPVYQRLARRIVEFQDSLPNRRGIECSVILKQYLTDFVHPTPFEFHFSDFHLDRYRQDEHYICGGFEDADLAAHLTVVYHRGKTLYGPAIRSVMLPVNERLYIQSLVYDIENAVEDIAGKPVYFTLNLCRVLGYLVEKNIFSKQEGGEWGLRILPSPYGPLINHCLAEYTGADCSSEVIPPEEWREFAVYMTDRINSMLD